MPDVESILKPLAGFKSVEAASFQAQLEELRGRVLADVGGLGPAALSWQPAPGTNTIGMLLAHLAIVELHWFGWGIEGATPPDFQGIIGMGVDDDGMPIPEGGRPPALLEGKTPADFAAPLARSRAYGRRVAEQLTDADLDRVREHPRRRGGKLAVNARWILYHVLEHEAAHLGQINLLRHLHRVSGSSREVAPEPGR